MHADWPASKTSVTVLRVDGGMTATTSPYSVWPILASQSIDRSSWNDGIGRAYLAGRAAGSALSSTSSPRNGGRSPPSSRAWTVVKGKYSG
jgi:hypothetical protein